MGSRILIGRNIPSAIGPMASSKTWTTRLKLNINMIFSLQKSALGWSYRPQHQEPPPAPATRDCTPTTEMRNAMVFSVLCTPYYSYIYVPRFNVDCPTREFQKRLGGFHHSAQDPMDIPWITTDGPAFVLKCKLLRLWSSCCSDVWRNYSVIPFQRTTFEGLQNPKTTFHSRRQGASSFH